MEDKKVEKSYSIKIIDTYIDKKTKALATNFGKVYKVPEELTDERAQELIKAKVAKVVSTSVETKGNKESKDKTQG